ncbi:MAG: DUF4097 domain-containing protein [Thermoplasmata archaeon]|nr:DUF4097 domain-containing protein [Thermoplasmata archaeon]
MRGISGAGLALAGLVLAAPASFTRAEEVVRTIRAELPSTASAGGQRFSVENFVGTMRIREGDVATVTAVATVYAESQALADAVRIEPVSGSDGTTLRVRYPYDRVSTFRYREPGDHSDGLWHSFESSSTYHYDGRSVKVNRGHGTWLHADVEVQVPRGETNGRFVNLVGLVEAEGLRGKLRFEVASADLRIARLEGTLELEGSSGDVRARDIKGTWRSDFSSGDVRLDGFDGESLELHASSGDFAIRNVKARRIVTETNSGDAKFLDADVEEFAAKATSGDIELEDVGQRLKTAEVSTSSGDVTLRLPRDASFDATTRQSSGDTRLGFRDGVSIEQHESQIAYHRGDHGARIRVRTSSGDFSLAPI